MATPDSMPSRINKSKIDGFLEIPDIQGPSKRDGHEDHIEVHDINFEMIAPYDPNTLSRKGRVSLDMVVFTKVYDMSSPYMKKALLRQHAAGRSKIFCRAQSRERPATISSSLSTTPRS